MRMRTSKIIELFKPIIDSNQKLQNEIIEDRNKLIETLNNFNKLKISSNKTEEPKIETSEKQLAIEPKKSENLIVSNLIANYLQDLTNKSNAGYSIKYPENSTYTIGNKIIVIGNNNLKIDSVVYNATSGLMELLLKKSPNLNSFRVRQTIL